MNQPLLLHIVERLEGLLGKLPETIRKPILSELTPLKELFLQQRPPRFLFTGSSKMPMRQMIDALFGSGAKEQPSDALTPVHRWMDLNLPGRGTISLLDARDPGDSAQAQIKEELKRQPADAIFFIDPGEKSRSLRRHSELLIEILDWNEAASLKAKIVVIAFGPENRAARLEEMLNAQPPFRDHMLQVIDFAQVSQPVEKQSAAMRRWMSILGQHLPNEARIEMIRISRDVEAQRQVAQVLVKSTTAVCAAIGAQPIPLADLPILTTLQLVMVSGIMYISGRERSLRAATEFIGALGANVGAGMLFREGTRAILKFFPGWGNVVCGMVAGAGTYAIGRAAIVFFLEGVSLKDAKRIYRASRKKPAQPPLSVGNGVKPAAVRRSKRTTAPLPFGD
jgi:uncharacterized protein